MVFLRTGKKTKHTTAISDIRASRSCSNRLFLLAACDMLVYMYVFVVINNVLSLSQCEREMTSKQEKTKMIET